MSNRSDRQQDGRHPARGLHQLMNAGAVRQWRHHQRSVILGGIGHQVGEDGWSPQKPSGPWGQATAALECPGVVPEVKKNQQGSSYSTATSLPLQCPGCAAIASL